MISPNGNGKIVAVLAQLRQEWEEAAEGESLLVLDGSVGLILADIAEAADLTPTETVTALGSLAELVA